MLVLVVLHLVRVCLQSIACWWCCLLTGFVCTLLHVSHGSVAPLVRSLSALYCMLVMVVCLLSGFVCTLLHVSHGSVVPCQGVVCTLLHVSHGRFASCQGLSALYCMLVLLMLLLVRVCLHSIAC